MARTNCRFDHVRMGRAIKKGIHRMESWNNGRGARSSQYPCAGTYAAALPLKLQGRPVDPRPG
jgi:hypothetical protein